MTSVQGRYMQRLVDQINSIDPFDVVVLKTHLLLEEQLTAYSLSLSSILIVWSKRDLDLPRRSTLPGRYRSMNTLTRCGHCCVRSTRSGTSLLTSLKRKGAPCT